MSRALNIAECFWVAVIAVCLGVDRSSTPATVLAVCAGALLLVQLAVVRPRLTRRTNQVLAGADAPRSTSHHLYIALEVTKVAVLLALGVTLSST